MKPTPSSRRAFVPTSLLAVALLVALSGCGATDSADDTTDADARNLFGRDAEQCRPFLDEAEQAQSEEEQRAALERYEVCIDSSDHMPDPDTGRDVDSCYDILEAVVRIQDDVSADIIRQLHDAYVDCVYDAVTGGGNPDPEPNPDDCEAILREGEERCFSPDGQEQGQDGAECWERVEREYNACIGGDPDPNPDDCHAWAHEACEPLLYEEQADGSMGDEAFARCLEAHLDMCDPGPGPDNCEVILREGEERCFGPNGEDWEGDECWAQIEREYNACIGVNPNPGPDQCLAEGQRRCEELLEPGMDGDPNDEPRDVAFGQCLEEVQRSCFPEPDPTDACVERAHDRCAGLLDGSEGQDPDQDPAESFERCLEAELDACFNEPDPGQCESILHEAQQDCSMADGDLDEQCLDAYRQEYERCLMGR